MSLDYRFKPMLLPNDPIGEFIDWHKRLHEPDKWLVSEKLEGIRIEIDIQEKIGYSRSLNKFRSVWLQKQINDMIVTTSNKIILEAEIYSEELNLEELKHFIMSKDVTSKETRRKLEREFRSGKWKYPRKDIDFYCNYPDSIKFYIFDYWMPINNKTAEGRYATLISRVSDTHKDAGIFHKKFVVIEQKVYEDAEDIVEAWNIVLEEGGEGLVVKRRDLIYQTKRLTIKQNLAFKMVYSGVEYSGIVIDILEGTKVIEDVPRDVNKLGYSVTSQSKFDREPSGMAKGILVKTLDGDPVVVTFKNINNHWKRVLLERKESLIGQEISFSGKKPTKPGGKPRQAKYNFRNFDLDFFRDENK